MNLRSHLYDNYQTRAEPLSSIAFLPGNVGVFDTLTQSARIPPVAAELTESSFVRMYAGAPYAGRTVTT